MSSILNRFIWHAADEDAPQSPCAWTILLVCWNCYCCLCYHRENLNWTDSGSITYVINVHLDFKAFAIHDLITPLKSDTCSKIIAYVSHNYSDIDCSMVDMVDGEICCSLLFVLSCSGSSNVSSCDRLYSFNGLTLYFVHRGYSCMLSDVWIDITHFWLFIFIPLIHVCWRNYIFLERLLGHWRICLLYHFLSRVMLRVGWIISF